jgi:hypothetical protein
MAAPFSIPDWIRHNLLCLGMREPHRRLFEAVVVDTAASTGLATALAHILGAVALGASVHTTAGLVTLGVVADAYCASATPPQLAPCLQTIIATVRCHEQTDHTGIAAAARLALGADSAPVTVPDMVRATYTNGTANTLPGTHEFVTAVLFAESDPRAHAVAVLRIIGTAHERLQDYLRQPATTDCASRLSRLCRTLAKDPACLSRVSQTCGNTVLAVLVDIAYGPAALQPALTAEVCPAPHRLESAHDTTRLAVIPAGIIAVSTWAKNIYEPGITPPRNGYDIAAFEHPHPVMHDGFELQRAAAHRLTATLRMSIWTLIEMCRVAEFQRSTTDIWHAWQQKQRAPPPPPPPHPVHEHTLMGTPIPPPTERAVTADSHSEWHVSGRTTSDTGLSDQLLLFMYNARPPMLARGISFVPGTAADDNTAYIVAAYAAVLEQCALSRTPRRELYVTLDAESSTVRSVDILIRWPFKPDDTRCGSAQWAGHPIHLAVASYPKLDMNATTDVRDVMGGLSTLLANAVRGHAPIRLDALTTRAYHHTGFSVGVPNASTATRCGSDTFTNSLNNGQPLRCLVTDALHSDDRERALLVFDACIDWSDALTRAYIIRTTTAKVEIMAAASGCAAVPTATARTRSWYAYTDQE